MVEQTEYRQGRERVHALCLAFLLEKTKRNPTTLSTRLQRSLMQARETIGTIRFIVKKPQKERQEYADSIIGVLEYLSKQRPDYLPEMETKIIEVWSNRRPKKDRELYQIAKKIYTRFNLPVPPKYSDPTIH